jgi:hypothetical protein
MYITLSGYPFLIFYVAFLRFKVFDSQIVESLVKIRHLCCKNLSIQAVQLSLSLLHQNKKGTPQGRPFFILVERSNHLALRTLFADKLCNFALFAFELVRRRKRKA